MDMLIFVACLHTRDASLAHSQGERRSFSMVDIRQGPRVKLTVLCVVTVVGEGQAKGFLEIVSTKLMVLYSPADIIIIVGIKTRKIRTAAHPPEPPPLVTISGESTVRFQLLGMKFAYLYSAALL